MQKHSVFSIIGASPRYVGHDQARRHDVQPRSLASSRVGPCCLRIRALLALQGRCCSRPEHAT